MTDMLLPELREENTHCNNLNDNCQIDVDNVQFESENWFAKYFIAFLFRWVCLYFSGAYAYVIFQTFSHII